MLRGDLHVPTPLTNMLSRMRPPRRVRLRLMYRVVIPLVLLVLIGIAAGTVTIARHAWRDASPVHVGVAAVLNLLVLGGFGLTWMSLRWARRLARDGAVAEGVVIGRRTVTRKQKTSYMITYEFQLPDGWYRRGTDHVDLERYEQLVEGAPVTVLYIAGRTHAHTLYECCPYEVKGVVEPKKTPARR